MLPWLVLSQGLDLTKSSPGQRGTTHPAADELKRLQRRIAELETEVDARRKASEAGDAESRFRAVAQSAKDAIISANSSGDIVFCNESAEEMFGYSERELVDRPLTLLMPARRREDHDRGMARHRSTGETNAIGKTLELEGLRKGGEEFPLELSLSTWSADGETYYTGIIRDISRRKRAEQDREKLILDLQSATATVKTLTGLLPICAWCKKIRDDKGYWNQIESYLREHSEVVFSHGVCPDCAGQLARDLDEPKRI